MRGAVIVLVMVAACGRFGFDASRTGAGLDGASDGAPNPTDATADPDGPVPIGPTVLGSAQDTPADIVVLGNRVYWRSGGSAAGVMRCPNSGCGLGPTVLPTDGIQPGGLAIEDDAYYWSDQAGRVVKVGTSGAATLATGMSNPTAIVRDATNVYWTNSVANGSVMRCAKVGCGNVPTTIVSGQASPSGIVIDASHAFWVNVSTGNIMTSTLVAGATPIVLATAQNAYAVAIDATNVYWADYNNGRILKCALGGCGGNPTILAMGQQIPRGIATDGTNVYWTNTSNGTSDSGSVMKCAVTGCASPIPLASNQGQPYAIVVDTNYVYWTNSGSGTVMLAPK